MKSVVRLWTEEAKTWARAEEISLGAMDWLVLYMAREKGRIIPSPANPVDCDLKPDDSQKSICAVCREVFSSRSALTKHFKMVHLPGAFNNPFNCPWCRGVGAEDVVISGAFDLETHMERFHGKAHAPKLIEEPTTKSNKSTCFVCEGQFSAGAPRHYNTHSEAFTSGKLVQCQECLLVLGEKSEHLSGDDMLLHRTRVHGHPAIVRCVLCNHFSTERGLATHMRGHFKSSPVTCPCSVAASEEERPVFHTFESWHLHAAGSSHYHGLPKAPRSGNAGAKCKRGHASGYPSPASSPGGMDEWWGKGCIPESKTDVVVSSLSPPASDIEETDGLVKRARLCSPTCGQESAATVIDTLDSQLATEYIEIF